MARGEGGSELIAHIPDIQDEDAYIRHPWQVKKSGDCVGMRRECLRSGVNKRKATETLVEINSVLNYFMSSIFLDIQIMDMQRQSGGDDCGLFAIASALCLCEGKDPGTHSWKQQSMRQHLLQCFTDGELKPLQSKKRRKRAAKVTQRVQLYCTVNVDNIM